MQIKDEELKRILIEVYKEGFYGTLDLANETVEAVLKNLKKVPEPDVPYAQGTFFWNDYVSSISTSTITSDLG